MNKKISLKTGINLFVITFSVVSVALSGFIVRNMAQEKMMAISIQKNGYISKSIAENLDLYLSNAMETVNTAAAFSSESNADRSSIQNEIFRIYDNFSYFDLIFFMDSSGKIQFSKPTNKTVTDVFTYQHRDYYDDVKEHRRSTISQLFMSSILNRPHFVLASPVFANGDWIGLIGCGIPLENIEKIIRTSRHNFDGKVWVIDASGSVVINPDSEQLSLIEQLSIPTIETKDGEKHNYHQLLVQRMDVDGMREYAGEKYISSVRMLEKFGWMIIVEQTEKSMQLEANIFNRQIMNALLLVLMMAVIFTMFFTSLITQPIERLVEDTENVGGDIFYIPKYNDNTFLEVEELAEAFVQMGDRIHRKIRDVEQANVEIRTLRQRLMDIFENLILGVVVCGNDGIINFINRKILTLTLFKEDEVVGIYIDDFYDKLGIDPKSMRKESDLHEPLVQVEIEIKTKEGKSVPVRVSANPLTTGTGERDGTLIIIDDLTEIKFLEDEIMREDRIRALGELSATIIHDIGNPLAGISNLIEVLHEGKLSEEERKEAYSIIHNEVADLNKMVREFLDYTRSKGMEKESINLGEFIKEIVALFRLEARKRDVAIEMLLDEEDVFLFVNRMELKQAFTNILKNAIYAVDKNGEVSISATKNRGKIDIVISDDGIGIAEEDLKKIFNPFFTTKDGGTGLGLPIAYKSIKANGGYISVGSVAGKGTSFIITFLE